MAFGSGVLIATLTFSVLVEAFSAKPYNIQLNQNIDSTASAEWSSILRYLYVILRGNEFGWSYSMQWISML
jgi:hypothetical protein